MPNPLIGMPQGAEWLVILAIVILVFGAAKLPELARGTGQALRIFKSETKGLKDEDEERDDSAGPATPEQRQIQAPGRTADSDEVVRERRDDTTA
jgi:sec-independent protein translocase protein TatA